MKKFHEVTILGLLFALFVCFAGCAVDRKGLNGKGDGVEAWIEPLSASELDARLSEFITLVEQGEVERAEAVLDEILRRNPEQPEALAYRKKLRARRYSTVYEGDTLSGIAAYYYGDAEKWSALARANKIASPEKMRPYRRLLIPWMPEYDEGKDETGRLRKRFFGGASPSKVLVVPVREGDSLAALAERYYGDKRLRFFLADYNQLATLSPLPQGVSLKVPVLPKQKRKRNGGKDRELLKRGALAYKEKRYEEACRCYAAVPVRSPLRKEALRLLRRCRSEGAAHYERLGDDAFERSRAKDACRYWRTALRLDPEREEVKRKLEEAEDLVKTLETLPVLP